MVERLEYEKAIMLIEPCYLSFESALYDLNIKSRGTYRYQAACLSNSYLLNLGKINVEFIKIPKDYFFGFVWKNGVAWAEPEKALLDYIYRCEMLGIKPDLYDVDWLSLNKRKLESYAEEMQIEIPFPDLKSLKKSTHPKDKFLSEELEIFLNR